MSIQLVRVTPDKVMEYWYQIRECIVAALPPYVEPSEKNFLIIQESMLTESLHCWVAMENSQIYGVCTTRFTRDETSGEKNLLIYTVTITEAHPTSLWRDCLATLSRFAIANNCRSILAFSENERVLEICTSIGANIDTRLIMFKL